MLFTFCLKAIWCTHKCEGEMRTDSLREKGRPVETCDMSIAKKNLYCNNLTDTEQVHNQKEVSDLIDILAHVRLFLQQWALLAL